MFFPCWLRRDPEFAQLPRIEVSLKTRLVHRAYLRNSVFVRLVRPAIEPEATEFVNPSFGAAFFWKNPLPVKP